MASVRVTTGKRSREKGTTVGMEVNTFGLKKLQGAVNGESMAQILLDAGQIAFVEAFNEWPVQTFASRDTLKLETAEVGPTHARVILQAGGPDLINDPRNTSHKDYAPFIEFNGTATAAPNIIARSIMSNDRAIRKQIHDAVAALIQEAASE